jgi:MATE family multidrug resistance protein
MPLVGISMAVSILVGQYLGRDEVDLAQKISKRGIHLAYFYILPLIILLVWFPDIFIKAFNIEENNPEFAKIYDMLVIILRFVAIYSLFDVINLVFAGTLKGAGDTTYILKIIGITSILVMVIPVYVSFSIFNASLYFGWSFVTLYVVVLGINFLIRFRSGKWKTKSVIREPNRFIVDFPEIPTPEI